MSTPETYQFIPDQEYLKAQDIIDFEFNAANSAVEYINYIQRMYSLPISDGFDKRKGDEVHFQALDRITEVHNLAEVARFMTISGPDVFDETTDAFFRGSLLGTHHIHHATENSTPSRDALLFLRKRIVRSAPKIKMSHQEMDLGDVKSMAELYHVMPAEDADADDPTAKSSDLLVRQGRIVSSLMSRLFPDNNKPAIPERYDVTARKIAGELAAISPFYEQGFLNGYRFMLQLYTQPDEHDRIGDIWDEYDGFKHIEDRSEQRATEEELSRQLAGSPESRYDSLREARARIINENHRLLARRSAKKVDLDQPMVENIGEELTDFATKSGLLIRGDLVQISGEYFALFESTDANGNATSGNVLEDEDTDVLGTYDGIDLIQAPTDKSLRQFYKKGDQSILEFKKFIPALRIKEPEFFSFDDSGKRHRLARDRQFIYRIPLIYTNTDIGRFTFENPNKHQ